MQTSGACIAFRTITFSASKDTSATVQQVREHNAAYGAVCPTELEEQKP